MGIRDFFNKEARQQKRRVEEAKRTVKYLVKQHFFFNGINANILNISIEIKRLHRALENYYFSIKGRTAKKGEIEDMLNDIGDNLCHSNYFLEVDDPVTLLVRDARDYLRSHTEQSEMERIMEIVKPKIDEIGEIISKYREEIRQKISQLRKITDITRKYGGRGDVEEINVTRAESYLADLEKSIKKTGKWIETILVNLKVEKDLRIPTMIKYLD